MTESLLSFADDWLKLDNVLNWNDKDSGQEEDEYDDEKDNNDLILRGPFWNYGRSGMEDEIYYSELLFGKKQDRIITAVCI